MEKPISVGDLVAITKATECCGTLGKGYGMVFTVSRIRRRTNSYCKHCESEASIMLADGCPNGSAYSIARLKRIPPLEELDDVKREETADA